MAKVYQWTNDTKLGRINDELDALWASLDDRRWQRYLPAGDFLFNAGGTAPVAAWNFPVGNDVAGLEFPDNGTTTVYAWTSFAPPTEWREAGRMPRVKWHYFLDTNGVALDVLRVQSQVTQYDASDPIGTPSATPMTLNTEIDVSAATANVVYTETVTAGSTFGDYEWLTVRLGRTSAHANDTYTGKVILLGATLSLV